MGSLLNALISSDIKNKEDKKKMQALKGTAIDKSVKDITGLAASEYPDTTSLSAVLTNLDKIQGITKTYATLPADISEAGVKTKVNNIANALIPDTTSPSGYTSVPMEQAPALTPQQPNVPQTAVTNATQTPYLGSEGKVEFTKPSSVVNTEVNQKAQEKAATELASGVPQAQAGLLTLAQESIKNIQAVKSDLFPDGTPGSFRRGAAYASNPVGNTAPIIGRVIPDFFPTEKGQEVFRKISAALSARQLIQTGVAARPEETQKLVSQFAPNLFSNPKAALDGLNELQDFYHNYIDNLRTRGGLSATTGTVGNPVPLPPSQTLVERRRAYYDQIKAKYPNLGKSAILAVVQRDIK